jgi:hypothetical protein
MGNQSQARMDIDRALYKDKRTFSPPDEDPRMSSGIPDPLLNESLYSGRGDHNRVNTMQDPQFREQLLQEEERMKIVIR